MPIFRVDFCAAETRRMNSDTSLVPTIFETVTTLALVPCRGTIRSAIAGLERSVDGGVGAAMGIRVRDSAGRLQRQISVPRPKDRLPSSMGKRMACVDDVEVSNSREWVEQYLARQLQPDVISLGLKGVACGDAKSGKHRLKIGEIEGPV